jgi:hypothetical protein
MAHQQDPNEFQYEALLVYHEGGNVEERDKIFERLLHRGPEIFDSLAEFVIKQPNEPRLEILLELLAKLGDLRAAPILIRFTEIEVDELRVQAVIGLGWLRARAALEILDVLEASDPCEDVRTEARIAVEEILRDFPNLRSMLKHHQTLSIGDEPIQRDSDDDIRRTTPPGGEERQRLVGMFPRLLALRFKAIPLGVGPGGVMGFAVDPAVTPDPRETLKALLGREVELHGWPLSRIYERLLTFYEWGDDDWVRWPEHLAPVTMEAIRSIVLEGVSAEEALPALQDASDAVEAAQSLLSLLATRQYVTVLMEYNDSGADFTVRLVGKDRAETPLEPPQGGLQMRLVRALELLSGLTRPGTFDAAINEGLIKIDHQQMQKPLYVVASRELLDERRLLRLDVLEPGVN